MNYSEQMQEIWKQYESSGMPVPATKHDVAEWAINNGLWKPRPIDIVSQCADDLAKALREEYRTGSNGQRVRTKHAVRLTQNGRQMHFWADIDTAPRQHMVRAFAQRRKQVVGDCYQLKTDVDYYNQKNGDIRPIQVVLDFTDDVAELQELETLHKAA